GARAASRRAHRAAHAPTHAGHVGRYDDRRRHRPATALRRPRVIPESVEPGPDELLVVVGPTASGKSALALDLAERLDGEIIGADSVQIYRAFDIGTGKPDAVAMAQVRHHLVDFVDPMEAFDAARFVDLADRAIDDVRARNRVPIVCGGTFLWV